MRRQVRSRSLHASGADQSSCVPAWDHRVHKLPDPLRYLSELDAHFCAYDPPFTDSDGKPNGIPIPTTDFRAHACPELRADANPHRYPNTKPDGIADHPGTHSGANLLRGARRCEVPARIQRVLRNSHAFGGAVSVAV